MVEKTTDLGRRRFLTAATSVVGGVGVVYAAVPFVASWQPSEKAKAAGAPVSVDISKLQPGQLLRVEWRGKPVWILKRSDEIMGDLNSHDDLLRDPSSGEESQQPGYCKNDHRSIRSEIFVAVGICTHLGCSPTYVPDKGGELGAKWPGGFFCPCHGSKFDLAGRVFNGVPAPTNLVIPPHHYVNDTRLLIGIDPEVA